MTVMPGSPPVCPSGLIQLELKWNYFSCRRFTRAIISGSALHPSESRARGAVARAVGLRIALNVMTYIERGVGLRKAQSVRFQSRFLVLGL